ncbi:hypothetical protein DFH28DRAFT_879903 [Melampsora americana]|nr:hypothetical protein DFH28DRAFT_879903 [Melampsora americana]
MSTSNLSNFNPTDFHHLKVKFTLPLAPIFLPRPPMKSINSIHQLNHPSSQEISIPLETPKDFSNRLDNSGGPIESINQILSTLLMKYIPNLGCVLLSYLSPPIFLFKDQNGNQTQQIISNQTNSLPFQIITGSAWSIINIKVKMLGWRPKIGDRLIGKPTMSSPSHLSLILYQTFNAFIPANHMLGAGYRYDPNVEIPLSWKQNGKDQKPFRIHSNSNSIHPTDLETHQDEIEICERGCWVDSNGDVVGGQSGVMTFTAISLTITNDMISVTGSLLTDPFSVPSNGSYPTQLHSSRRSSSQTLNSSNSEDEDEEESVGSSLIDEEIQTEPDSQVHQNKKVNPTNHQLDHPSHQRKRSSLDDSINQTLKKKKKKKN